MDSVPEGDAPPPKKPNRSVGPLRKGFFQHARGGRSKVQAPRTFGPLRFELHGVTYERQIGRAWYVRGKGLRRVTDQRMIEMLEAKYLEQHPEAR